MACRADGRYLALFGPSARINPLKRHDTRADTLHRQPAAAPREYAPARAPAGEHSAQLTALQDYIDRSPGMRAQRRAIDAAFGRAIQREEAEAASAGSDAEVARAGFSGAPAPTFPHRDAIEHSFGRSLPATAYTDEAASRASAALDAPGFTLGTQVGFASPTPGLELAAHEAAHVMQGTSGVQLHGGDGAYEDHADAVAARVLHGESAADLLVGGPVAAPAVRRGRNRGHHREHAGKKSQPIEKAAQALAQKLRQLILRADWRKIRKSAYPNASKQGIRRARKRRDGQLPELTGLGRMATIDQFVGLMKVVQANWEAQTAAERLDAVTDVVDRALRTAGVPTLRDVTAVDVDHQGAFCREDWDMELRKGTLAQDKLSDRVAAVLSNTLLHEARHAEQVFVAARLAAGPPRNLFAHDAPVLASEHGIPVGIASDAIATNGMGNASPDPEFSKDMLKAWVTEGAPNQQISNDDYHVEMQEIRERAKLARKKLLTDPDESGIAEAAAVREELAAAIEEVKQRYLLYRNIPYEVDAHEVGDAAEVAFLGLA